MATARELALSVLLKCENSGQYSNLALDASLRKNQLTQEDRALFTVLVYGVIEKRLTLDYQISQLCSRPIEKLDPLVRETLRLGLYQLAYLDRVPDHAAVNETVSLAPKKASGLVNAVLREFSRRGKKITLPEEKKDEIFYLSVKYSVGSALVQKYLKIFGKEKTVALLEAFSLPPKMTLFVNTLHLSREELLARFFAAGVCAEPTRQSPFGVRLLEGASLNQLPGFAKGDFFVQDEASQLAVCALDAAPGMRVLDVCSCPGSKSFGIAISLQNKGELLACDLHASKLSLVRTGAEKLGIQIISTLERDGRKPLPEKENYYDRILCDVPCSGFGVLAKKPELRYKDPKESAELPQIQSAILDRSATLLKQGGKLVYSTCTLLPEENEQTVRGFLNSHPNFSLLSSRTTYPDTDGTDGFFFAVLAKN